MVGICYTIYESYVNHPVNITPIVLTNYARIPPDTRTCARFRVRVCVGGIQPWRNTHYQGRNARGCRAVGKPIKKKHMDTEKIKKIWQAVKTVIEGHHRLLWHPDRFLAGWTAPCSEATLNSVYD